LPFRIGAILPAIGLLKALLAFLAIAFAFLEGFDVKDLGSRNGSASVKSPARRRGVGLVGHEEDSRQPPQHSRRGLEPHRRRHKRSWARFQGGCRGRKKKGPAVVGIAGALLAAPMFHRVLRTDREGHRVGEPDAVADRILVVPVVPARARSLATAGSHGTIPRLRYDVAIFSMAMM
jgi:hypothetical protein